MLNLDFGINKAKRSQVLRQNVTKKTNVNSKSKTKYSGLNKKQEFILEKTCLEKLNNNFKCLCRNKCRHFPSIVSISNGSLKLSNCGISLNNYRNFVKNKEIDPIRINNVEEQIHRILNNLEKNNIKHLDMCLDGKNLCVKKGGILSLIDFNIASINNKYNTNKIKKRLQNYGNDRESYNKYMKSRIIQTIKNTM